MKESFTLAHPDTPEVMVLEQEQGAKPERRRNLYAAETQHHSFEEVINLIRANNELDELCIEGMFNRHINSLAKLNNILTSLSLSLTDREIDDVSNFFIQKLKPAIGEYERRRLEALDANAHGKNRKKGEFSLQSLSAGIKTAVHFLRQEKIRNPDTELEKSIYYEPYLDVYYGIDYIEIVTHKEGRVVVNLIQLKSSTPDWSEVDKTVKKHRDWVQNLIDLKTYEDSIMKVPEDTEVLQETLGTVESIKDSLLDMLTSETSPDDKTIIQHLIGDRPDAERLWILSQYIDNLTEAIESLKEEGLPEETYQETRKTLSRMRGHVNQALEKKRDLKGVQAIYSKFFVGEKEIHSQNLYTNSDTVDGKAIQVKGGKVS